MLVHMIPEQNIYKERSLHNYRLGRHISETQHMESTLLLGTRHLEVLNPGLFERRVDVTLRDVV